MTGDTSTAPDTYQAVLDDANAIGSDCLSPLETPTTDIDAMTNGFASVTPLNPTPTPDAKWKKFRFLAKISYS